MVSTGQGRRALFQIDTSLSANSQIVYPDRVSMGKHARKHWVVLTVLVQPRIKDQHVQLTTGCFSGSGVDYWIGLHQPDPHAPFAWSDQTPVNYTDWNGGEPNDATGEDCVMYKGKFSGWNDIFCSQRFFFVCKVSASCN